MKNTLRTSFLALTLCTSALMPAAWTKQPLPGFEVGTLSSDLMDVGCSLIHRKADWNSEPIFIETALGANWIQLNGQTIKLMRVQEGVAEFVAEEVHVKVHYGPGKRWGKDMDKEAEVYNRASLEVRYKGQTQIIPAKGTCGC